MVVKHRESQLVVGIYENSKVEEYFVPQKGMKLKTLPQPK